ncbi:MAG TPA: NlpC/P60 family protein [Baekduia sp.]|uniref:C40 family peptidase n=1 Tax=Baekduia sp. TaxID=2600305 RepID=UPI002D788AE7|nr:NlpC/P60 family protein [Baekduia sp.]HET6509202.1 NlpC/P60 family protein [Baekduia sp.]
MSPRRVPLLTLLCALALAGSATSARAAAPLTGTRLHEELGRLALSLGVEPVSAPFSKVSVTSFDALMVRQLGASDVAASVQHEAWRAGLTPPPTFGTEAVARLLGLRDNLPYRDDARELYPTDAITLAEAKHSFAVASRWQGGAAEWVRGQFSTFALPRYSTAQRRVLALAISKVGMPYVWGGETDTRGAAYGGQVHGGYDCSGFAWRVFKLSGFSWGTAIHGRTAAQQAGEIQRSARIRLDDVRGGDLVFFGPGRFWMKATEQRIVHEGLALSPDWMVHSSDQGVYVSPLRLDPWRAKRFSWARRVLP